MNSPLKYFIGTVPVNGTKNNFLVSLNNISDMLWQPDRLTDLHVSELISSVNSKYKDFGNHKIESSSKLDFYRESVFSGRKVCEIFFREWKFGGMAMPAGSKMRIENVSNF